MASVEKTMDINAPVAMVFDFVANQPDRMADWWPPIELQERVTPAPTEVGSVSRYVYDMMGVKIKGEHKVIEMSVNERIVVETTSGIDSTFDFMFAPADGGTRLTIRVDYKLPGSVLGQLLNRLAIEQKNTRDLEDGLDNLKQMLEAQPSNAG
jgi:uncharacterized protein YndB with AHSA1/START domain